MESLLQRVKKQAHPQTKELLLNTEIWWLLIRKDLTLSQCCVEAPLLLPWTGKWVILTWSWLMQFLCCPVSFFFPWKPNYFVVLGKTHSYCLYGMKCFLIPLYNESHLHFKVEFEASLLLFLFIFFLTVMVTEPRVYFRQGKHFNRNPQNLSFYKTNT